MSAYLSLIERAKRYSARLRADDPRFNGRLIVQHWDGSEFRFRHAFAGKVEDFYVVFTEHHGIHIYSVDDVTIDTAQKEIPEMDLA